MLNQCYLLLSALLRTYSAAGTHRDVGTGPHHFYQIHKPYFNQLHWEGADYAHHTHRLVPHQIV